MKSRFVISLALLALQVGCENDNDSVKTKTTSSTLEDGAVVTVIAEERTGRYGPTTHVTSTITSTNGSSDVVAEEAYTGVSLGNISFGQGMITLSDRGNPSFSTVVIDSTNEPINGATNSGSLILTLFRHDDAYTNAGTIQPPNIYTGTLELLNVSTSATLAVQGP